MGCRFRRTSVLLFLLLIFAIPTPVTPAQLDDWGFVAVPSTANRPAGAELLRHRGLPDRARVLRSQPDVDLAHGLAGPAQHHHHQ